MDAVVYETANERHLLNHFLCKLQNLDPDIYAVNFSHIFKILLLKLEFVLLCLRRISGPKIFCFAFKVILN